MSLATLALLLPALLAAAPATHAGDGAGHGATPAVAAPADPHGPPAEPAPPPTPAASSLVLYPSLGRPTLVTVSGRVVASRPAGRPQGPARLVAEVALAGQVRRVEAGPDGLFQVSFPAPADRPHQVGLRPVSAAAGGLTADGLVQVVDDGAPFLLVVEVDDLAGVVTRREAGAQAATPAAMAALLRCMVAGTQPAVGAVAVSGAAPERLGRLQAALQGGFPFMGLQLRPPGSRGDPAEAALRALLSGFPHPVLLLGDAGGRAPERFAALRREFGQRVIAVYLRGSAPGAVNPRFQDMTLFTEPLRAAQLAAGRGLADQACVEAALEAAAAPPPAPAAAGGAPCPACPCPCPAQPAGPPPPGP
ncbi:MAG: hypothetical protein IPO09_01780 [Anaeromyxobacter sp.]|nr:hypothetical protein [Anaeromyxobacter sp.]MBL0278110.1 hypothetical protein [Anaeromyxobacter sp.]